MLNNLTLFTALWIISKGSIKRGTIESYQELYGSLILQAAEKKNEQEKKGTRALVFCIFINTIVF